MIKSALNWQLLKFQAMYFFKGYMSKIVPGNFVTNATNNNKTMVNVGLKVHKFTHHLLDIDLIVLRIKFSHITKVQLQRQTILKF